MPKIAEDTLSPVQAGILLAMDYIERRSGEGGLISGAAIAHVLRGRWDRHRAKATEILASSGWITIHTMAHDRSGKKYYMLTEDARIHLDRRLNVPEGEFIPMATNWATEELEQ